MRKLTLAERTKTALAEYNDRRTAHDLPALRLHQIGVTKGRKPKHDVMIEFLGEALTPGLFVIFRFLVLKPDGSTGERYVRVDLKPTLVVVPVVNNHILLLNRFRHGVGGLRWNLPRGWTNPHIEMNDQERVTELLDRLLGPVNFPLLGRFTVKSLGTVDEDDAVRETPMSVYALNTTMDLSDPNLEIRYKGAQFRVFPLAEAMSLARDEASLAAFLRFAEKLGLIATPDSLDSCLTA